MAKGLLIVVSGPSGCGKGTVCKALLAKRPDICISVSVTTRAPREGETEGVNYFFRTPEQFREMIQEDAFLEYACVFDNYYGTPKEYVERMLDEGKDVLLEIDVQGALKVKERAEHGVYIFIAPPSLEELKTRLVNRGTETAEVVEKRLHGALHELELLEKYSYVVVNDLVDNAVEHILAILEAERCCVGRNKDIKEKLLGGNIL